MTKHHTLCPARFESSRYCVCPELRAVYWHGRMSGLLDDLIEAAQQWLDRAAERRDSRP